ncbi:hypothetical protein [Shewanella colwelliana]|uniref:hypothetical protein n=1 Tax=Shewanella colwelliana TaxID=23 RepID=UPI001C7D4FBB|nr:hypothetical protein [Shewanella colwelliana]
MKTRSHTATARHAESLIKIGENIPSAIILTLFVAPMIFLNKQVVDGKVDGLTGLWALLTHSPITTAIPILAHAPLRIRRVTNQALGIRHTR